MCCSWRANDGQHRRPHRLQLCRRGQQQLGRRADATHDPPLSIRRRGRRRRHGSRRRHRPAEPGAPTGAPAPATAPPARAAAGSPFRSGVRNLRGSTTTTTTTTTTMTAARRLRPPSRVGDAAAAPVGPARHPLRWDALGGGAAAAAAAASAAAAAARAAEPARGRSRATRRRRRRCRSCRASRRRWWRRARWRRRSAASCTSCSGSRPPSSRTSSCGSAGQELLLGQQESHVRMLKRQLHLREQGLRAAPADGDCPCRAARSLG